MTKIYSYILRIDDGAAPNPFWETCTLTICKPAIRRSANIGDWVIGTGSKNTKLKDGKKYDFSKHLVYAMKITDKKSLKDYNEFCKKELSNKIPIWETNDWRLRLGDCIYDYSSNNNDPIIRKGVHKEIHRNRDIKGINALLSNHFYYFGVESIPFPPELKELIKRNQGHKKIIREDLIQKFENWIFQFEKNKIYAEPQMAWLFDFTNNTNCDQTFDCIKERQKLEVLEDELEEVIC